MTIFFIYNLWFCDFFSDVLWNCLIIFLELSELLVTGFSYCCRHVSDQQLNFPRPKVIYHREVTWRFRALVRTHRTLNTTSCRHCVAFVCPAGIDYYNNWHLRVAFVCHRVTFCWHRTCFRCSLAVEQVRGHLVSISRQCDTRIRKIAGR